MSRQGLIAVCIVGLLVSTAVPVVTSANNQYSISVTNHIDTPPRTVSFQGTAHTISAVGRTAPSDTLSVSIDAPEDSSYKVLLYNSDREIAGPQKSGIGDNSLQFDMTEYEPGSYLLTIYKDGYYKAVYPVVVQGYTTTVDAPSRAATDSEIPVTVTADKSATVEDPTAVKIVLTAADKTIRVTATKDSAQTYHGTFSLDTIPAGSARIYAVVQGSEDAFGEDRKELLAISESPSLTIYEETTQTTTTAADPATPTVTTTAELTTSPTNTATTLTTTSSPTPPLSTSLTSTLPTTTSTERPPTTQPPATTSDASVITPAQTTSTTTTLPGPAIPGFGLSSALAGLCGFLILSLRR